MSTSPFEVPNELRDFAERSVDQARKAFEGFLTVAQRASDALGEAGKPTAGAKSVSSHVLTYAERNVNAAFDLAERPAPHHESVRKGAAGSPALL